MKYHLILIIVLLVISGSFFGCATVLTGYENDVILTDVPADVKIYDRDNIEVPVYEKYKTRMVRKSTGADVDSQIVVGRYISLRSNTDHLLVFKGPAGEKKIRLYPKLSAGWFVLDLLTGTVFVDWYTGNWNHFDDIGYNYIR